MSRKTKTEEHKRIKREVRTPVVKQDTGIVRILDNPTKFSFFNINENLFGLFLSITKKLKKVEK